VARAHGSFKLDSHRQIWRITNAMVALNGTLIKSHAEMLVARLGAEDYPDPLPRDIVLELTTQRHARPSYLPPRPYNFSPRQMNTDTALRLFKECGMFDDVRLTRAGSGDPLLASNAFDVIEAALVAGIRAIRIETDLLGVDAAAAARELAGAVDILAVNLPACSDRAYAQVMGIEAYQKVLGGIEKFYSEQDVGDHGTPLLIPLFTPTVHNAGEEKAWFERWPYGVSAAHTLSPVQSKLVVLADGRIVSNDPGESVLGVVGQTPIAQAWLKHPLIAA
jgi:hypothetical protein